MKRSKLLLAAGMALAAASASRALVRRSRRFSFADKTVLVTGGSRGLGLVLARQLVDAGARVAICARTPADLEEAERELRARGGEALSLRCDVSRPEEVHSAVRRTLQRFGGIDVLCNLAGIIQVGPLEAMTREDFQRAMDVHFWGALNTTLEVLPLMRRRGWGRIVNVASLGGKRAVPHMLPYTASKFALVACPAACAPSSRKTAFSSPPSSRASCAPAAHATRCSRASIARSTRGSASPAPFPGWR